MPPKSEIKKNGSAINFAPLPVEISINGIDYTKSGRKLRYFKNPKILSVHVNSKSKNLELNNEGGDYIYATIENMVSIEKYISKLRCKITYTNKKQSDIFEGELISYPYSGEKNALFNTISCVSNKISAEGNGHLSFAINGEDYFGNIKIKVIPFLKITKLSPQCSSVNFSIETSANFANFKGKNLNNYYLSMSGICKEFPKTFNLKKGNIKNIGIPKSKNHGVMRINIMRKQSYLVKGSSSTNTQFIFKHDYQNEIPFYYYKQPTIHTIFPHCSAYNLKENITVLGTFFFEKNEFNCYPICHFGSKTVRAIYVSNTSIECPTPLLKEDELKSINQLRISLSNGKFFENKFAFVFYR